MVIIRDLSAIFQPTIYALWYVVAQLFPYTWDVRPWHQAILMSR